MDTRIFGAGLCVILCAAGIAAKQSHPGDAIRMTTRNPQARPSPAELALSDHIGHLDDAAEAALQAGKFAEAEADARESMSVGQDSGRAQMTLSQALDAQGKTEEALAAYKMLSDEGVVSPGIQLPYALLLLKAGRWAQAVAAYDTALRLRSNTDTLRDSYRFSPSEPEPRDLATAIHIALGVNGDFRGHYWHQERTAGDPTLSDYRQALALEPNNPLAHLYYGFGLRQLGRRAEAKAAFAKATALGDDHIKAAAERFAL